MLFSDVSFFVDQLSLQQVERKRDALLAVSFSAWQILYIRDGLKTGWEEYARKLGLHEKVKLSKEDLLREEKIARSNVERILKKAQGKK